MRYVRAGNRTRTTDGPSLAAVADGFSSSWLLAFLSRLAWSNDAVGICDAVLSSEAGR